MVRKGRNVVQLRKRDARQCVAFLFPHFPRVRIRMYATYRVYKKGM